GDLRPRPADPRRAGHLRGGGAGRLLSRRRIATGDVPGRSRMSLAAGLAALAAKGTPVRVGVVGAGKFASMFLAQAPRTPGLHVVAVADLNVERARASLARVGWAPERSAAQSPSDALATGGTFITDDA